MIFSAISAASLTLRELLEPQHHAEHGHAQRNRHSPGISQRDARGGIQRRVLVAVQSVADAGDVEQRASGTARERVAAPTRCRALQLYYLVTPIMNDALTRHTVLGRVLQVFHDHSILRGTDLQGVLENSGTQLRVNLEALTIEELSLVWDALSEPYQLSVTYLVQVIKIDSDMEPVKAGIVLERDVRYTEIVAET